MTSIIRAKTEEHKTLKSVPTDFSTYTHTQSGIEGAPISAWNNSEGQIQKY